MKTFIDETIDTITASGHTTSDIVFIGSRISGHCCHWDDLVLLGGDTPAASCSGPDTAIDLVIVFADGVEMVRKITGNIQRWSIRQQPAPIYRKMTKIFNNSFEPSRMGDLHEHP